MIFTNNNIIKTVPLLQNKLKAFDNINIKCILIFKNSCWWLIRILLEINLYAYKMVHLLLIDFFISY